MPAKTTTAPTLETVYELQKQKKALVIKKAGLPRKDKTARAEIQTEIDALVDARNTAAKAVQRTLKPTSAWAMGARGPIGICTLYR